MLTCEGSFYVSVLLKQVTTTNKLHKQFDAHEIVNYRQFPEQIVTPFGKACFKENKNRCFSFKLFPSSRIEDTFWQTLSTNIIYDQIMEIIIINVKLHYFAI